MKKYIVRVVGFLVCMILIVVLPFIKNAKSLNFDRIYGVFVGNRIKNQQIIEIWNVDSFEAGDKSKTQILNSLAKVFINKNQGIYLVVRNVSQTECENMLASGQKPDLISGSYLVAKKIQNCVQEFNISVNEMYDNFVNAGSVDSKLYAIAWCASLYYLISSKDSLVSSGVSDFDNFSFAQNALNLGYQTTGKKTKTVFSLSFVKKNKLMPLEALFAYNKQGANDIKNLSFDKSQKFSQNDAYVNFLLGKSVALLGSNRDVLKILKRQANGKFSNAIIEPINAQTDMVQFMFLMDKTIGEKKIYAEKFVEFLISQNSQKQIAQTNVFSVLKNLDYQYENSYFESSKNLENLILKNIFD